MILLFLVILLVPLVSRYQPVNARWGVELDIFFFWKDKILWALSFLLLFFIKKTCNWLTIFWFFLFWATLFSIDIPQSIWGMSNYAEGSITFLCYGLLFLAAANMTEDCFDVAIGLSVLSIGLLAALQLYYGSHLLFPPVRWASGLSGVEVGAIKYPLYMSFANPNHLGLYCALLFPIFIRIPNYYLSFLTFLLAVGSCSRGAWLAILLTLPRKIWKWVPVVAFLSVLFFYHSIIPKLSTSSPERLFMWKHGIKLLHLLGKGPGTFMLYFPQNLITQAETGWAPGIWVDRPHNMFIQISHATGLLSLIPLLGILWGAVKRESVYRYGIFGFLIAGIFTDSMVGVTPIFAILVGLLYFKNREAALESYGEYFIWKRYRRV